MLPAPSMSSTWSVRSPHRTGAASPWAGSNNNHRHGSMRGMRLPSQIFQTACCLHVPPLWGIKLSIAWFMQKHPCVFISTQQTNSIQRKFDPKKSLLCKKALQKRCGDICAPAAPKQACWNAQKTFSTKPCRRWWGRVELTSQSIGISVAAYYKPCLGLWASISMGFETILEECSWLGCAADRRHEWSEMTTLHE